jgi:hypothetical protein
MTARQFAEEMRINYRTALNWLEAELVPGAEKKSSPIGEYWEIPETALQMDRPKPGPKPGAKRSPPGATSTGGATPSRRGGRKAA